MKRKRSTLYWCEMYGIRFETEITEPNGWNRKKLEASINEQITHKEWLRRIQMSICQVQVIDKLLGKVVFPI